MAELVLYHHARGITPGVEAFAERLRKVGHTVHLPDLFDGRTFDTIQEGVSYAGEVGFDTIIARGVAAAEELGSELVYAGISLGALPAQKLAQTRPGARGALLLEGCVPVSEFSESWPADVPVQVHGMDADPFFAEDVEAARALVASAKNGELFLYPGKEHLATDSSFSTYDEPATAQIATRVIAFLDAVSR